MRDPRVSRATARTVIVLPDLVHGRLAELLAAVTGPVQPQELRDEYVARSLFRAAAAACPPPDAGCCGSRRRLCPERRPCCSGVQRDPPPPLSARPPPGADAPVATEPPAALPEPPGA
jgi:hypothetical protein